MIDSVGADTTDYYELGLIPESFWCYKVSARNQDGLSALSNEACATTLASIDETQFSYSKITLYPNPSNGLFTVDFNKSIIEIRLTDLIGNLVFHQRTNNQTSLHIDNLQSGVYILTAIDKDNHVLNRKVISSH